VSSQRHYDPYAVRAQFPILSRTVHGGVPLVYLDSAATTQKPDAVITAIDQFYCRSNSNVHRAAHALSAEATSIWEGARARVARFLGAQRTEEVVFTRGTTESINLVAASWGSMNVHAGDEILITGMEHHANIVPWQLLCERTGAVLKAVPVLDDGSLDISAIDALLTDRTRLFAMVHASNTTGTINDVGALCAMAAAKGVRTLVDGAQAVLHQPVDVQAIGCDFYVFSAHKLYGPTGLGVLWGRYDLLDAMPPYQGGGAMIQHVSLERSVYEAPPLRFEAGTPHIAGAAGLGAAIDWFDTLDLDAMAQHEDRLTHRATSIIYQVEGARVIGEAPRKIGVVSFVIEGVHGTDLGMLLDEQGVATRTGHHCTMPLLERFHVGSTCRVSFAAYSTNEDLDVFERALTKAVRMLR
jgi:cysteine desulfurase/selenocysteine lyase